MGVKKEPGVAHQVQKSPKKQNEGERGVVARVTLAGFEVAALLVRPAVSRSASIFFGFRLNPPLKEPAARRENKVVFRLFSACAGRRGPRVPLAHAISVLYLGLGDLRGGESGSLRPSTRFYDHF